MSFRWTKILVLDDNKRVVEEYPLDKDQKHIKHFKNTKRRNIKNILENMGNELPQENKQEDIECEVPCKKDTPFRFVYQLPPIIKFINPYDDSAPEIYNLTTNRV